MLKRLCKIFMTAELEKMWKEAAVYESENTLVGLLLQTRTPTGQ
jgi:hypothetical protein